MRIHGSYSYPGQYATTYDGVLGQLIPTLIPNVVDNVVNVSPTLRAFKARGAFQKLNGDVEIVYRVRYRSGASSVGGQAPGFASIRFGGDPYATNVQLSDGSSMTGAAYPPVRIFTAFSLAQPDIDRRKYNPDALGNWVQQELQAFVEDIGKRVNDTLWRVNSGEGITVQATGFGNPGTRDTLGSIAYYVSDTLNHATESPASWNATSTQRLGGIDAATQTWWRSQYQNGGSGSGGALTFKDLSKAYIQVEALTGRSPTVVFCDPDTYAKIEDLFVTQARVMFAKEDLQVTGGFTALAWRNAIIVAESRVPPGTQTNRKRLYMCTIKPNHFELWFGIDNDPKEVPVLLDARAWKVTGFAQLGCASRIDNFVFDNLVV